MRVVASRAHARRCAHSVADARFDARFFDKKHAFVLDIEKISLIIYIWYEGGWLSPPVVTA